MSNTGVTVNGISVDKLADEVAANVDTLETIDGGDHIINIWRTKNGERRIAVQGTGIDVTLLTVH